MIKVRLVPEFFLAPNHGNDNFYFGTQSDNIAYYLECQLPCLPPIGSAIVVDHLGDEIAEQFISQAMRFNKNLLLEFDRIRELAYPYDRKENKEIFGKLKNASNKEIIDFAMDYEDGPWYGAGVVTVKDYTFMPNEDVVYIQIRWDL